jgi:hypothetical protein
LEEKIVYFDEPGIGNTEVVVVGAGTSTKAKLALDVGSRVAEARKLGKT